MDKYFIIIGPVPLIVVFRYYGTDYADLNTICIGFLCSCIIAGLVKAFFVYAIHPNTFDDTPSLPWSIKEAQMTALREQAASKSGGFAGLRFSPALHDYFEMN